MSTSMLKIWGQIPDADGAVVAKALDRVIDDHLRAQTNSGAALNLARIARPRIAPMPQMT
jgi:hypothetical protein